MGLSCSQESTDESEIPKICADSCGLSAKCDLFVNGVTESECRDLCVPNFTKLLQTCPAQVELMVCLATLSCEEYDAYVEVLDAYMTPDRYTAWDYPCKEANLRYMDECFSS